MSIQPELKTVLKRLKLSGMLPTLPDRLAYARNEKLDFATFLELVLSDEVERRDQKHVTNRLSAAGFEQECTLERFDWSAKIRIDKGRLTDLFGLHFIERHENVIFCGPVGVGKSFLAQALGHAACRANYKVLFIKADLLLKTLARSRADNSFDRELRGFISPDLLIVDDFALRKLSSQATSDFYSSNAIPAAPRFSPRIEESRNGCLSLMNRCSVRALWTASVTALISSSSMASLTANVRPLHRRRH